MKSSQILKFTFTALLLCVFALSSFAQERKAKSISDADKKAIINIFKDVDPAEYRLIFSDGKQTYGKKRIQMSDLKTISRKSTTAAKGVKWTFVVGDRSANEVVYVYTEGMSKMASLLGTKKLKALQAISDRYDDVAPR